MNPKILLLVAALLLSACAGSIADHIANGRDISVNNYDFSIVALAPSEYDVTSTDVMLAPDDIVAYRNAQAVAVEQLTHCKVSDVVQMDSPFHVIMKVNCAASNQVAPAVPLSQ